MKRKKTLLFTCLTLLILTVNAQITIENAYDGYTQPAKLDVEGQVYYSVDFNSSSCLIYDTNHSLWKTINILPPENKFIYDVHYVSQHLFNTDDLVEMAVEFFEYKEENGTGYYEYATEVVNEEGSVLLSVEGGAFPTVFLTSDNTAKLSVYVYDYAQFTYPVATHIYSIPGIPLSVENKSYDEFPGALGTPFPNPASRDLTIPVDLRDPRGNFELVITDVTGNTVKRSSIPPFTKQVNINVSEFGQGTYFYWFEANGSKSESRKMIVK